MVDAQNLICVPFFHGTFWLLIEMVSWLKSTCRRFIAFSFIQPCDPLPLAAGALSFSWLTLVVTKASFSSLSILMTRWMLSCRSNSARMSFSSALLCTSSDYGIEDAGGAKLSLVYFYDSKIKLIEPTKWWHAEKTFKFGIRWMIAMDHMDVVSDCIPHGSNIGKQICLNEHTRHTISFSCYNLRWVSNMPSATRTLL